MDANQPTAATLPCQPSPHFLSPQHSAPWREEVGAGLLHTHTHTQSSPEACKSRSNMAKVKLMCKENT